MDSNIKDSSTIDELIGRGKQKHINFSLENIRNALQEINNPCKDIPAIQVAGTNGKGSIVSFLKSCLNCSKIKVGITTSPHLKCWTERISIGDELISINDFKERVFIFSEIANKHDLSTFELTILIALDYFATKKVDLLILEAGLGGRLDATTAHPNRPIVAFGAIGLDHCEYLGNRIEDIAEEKAHIITRNSTVISGPQDPLARRIIEKHVYKKEAHIKWVNKISSDWDLGLRGTFQQPNAAVAKGILDTLKTMGWLIKSNHIKEGLKTAKWEGRLQEAYWNKLPILIDCAHNPDAAKALSQERKNWDYEKNGVNWILGIQSHKEGDKMIEYLIKPNDHCWIAPVNDQPSWNTNKLSRSIPTLRNKLIEVNDVEEALNMIYKKGEWPKPIPVICGSIYLIGSLLKKGVINTISN